MDAPAPQLLRPLSASASPGYRWRVWLAVLSLLGFLAAYLGLAAWFVVTAYRLTWGTAGDGEQVFWGWLVGACSALLALFMLKALFFRKPGGADDLVPVTEAEQPALFAELYAVADAVGAPRPHKVYVSARVNAAVFYDISPLNLLWPSKKNLEIGLGLVQALSLGELRAVLAHEFGHFAQRAMAVGRWVYVAQQVAAQVVAKRDKLDAFLEALSRFDFRVAWVGWLLSLIIWAIRSLVDSAFQGVLLLQRQLSREMEFGADAVAVAMTGSDALVHALHKLQAADNDWSRAWALAQELAQQGKPVADLFALQGKLSAAISRLLDDPHYGGLPAGAGQAGQRIFEPSGSNTPRMWLTHPLNHEREDRAKADYLAAPIDERSAWALFVNAEALRRTVSAKALGTAADAALLDEAALAAEVAQRHAAEPLQPRYRGAYLGRALTRHVEAPAALWTAPVSVDAAALSALYPPDLADATRRLRQLDGAAETDANRAERDALLTRLQAHDLSARSLHLALARAAGAGWEAYLLGLLALLHYAEHCEARLADARAQLALRVHEATRTRKVSDSDRQRIVKVAGQLRDELEAFYVKAPQLELDAPLAERMELQAWREALGELRLPFPGASDIGDWLQVIDSWCDLAGNAFARLRSETLALLLSTEASLADYFLRQQPVAQAPDPSRAPQGYATLRRGAEQPREVKLSAWARFQTAHGWLPATARLAVAGSLVVGVLGFSNQLGQADVVVYNGLPRGINVRISGAGSHSLAAYASERIPVEPGQALHLETRTRGGELIEQFDAEPLSRFATQVYNVAGAAPLVELTYYYGGGRESPPPRVLGAPRWSASSFDLLFTHPPQSVQAKKGETPVRRVLYGGGDAHPALQHNLLHEHPEAQAHLAALHVRWDPPASPGRYYWLALVRGNPAHDKMLAEALAREPHSIELMRERFDTLAPADLVPLCQRLGERAATGTADDVYLAARCLPEGSVRDAALMDGYARFGDHPWLAYGAGWVLAGDARWPEALRAFEQAGQVPTLAPFAMFEGNRIRRLLGYEPKDGVSLGTSSRLQAALGLKDSGRALVPEEAGYQQLSEGRIEAATSAAAQPGPRLLRLAAASDGASAALRQRVKALPADQGLDSDTVWSALALAEREGWPTEPLWSQVRLMEPRVEPQQRARLQAFWQALHGKDLLAAPAHLKGLTPELRGQAYSMATVLLGPRTPAAWRDQAKRLLLPSERPYFQ